MRPFNVSGMETVAHTPWADAVFHCMQVRDDGLTPRLMRPFNVSGLEIVALTPRADVAF